MVLVLSFIQKKNCLPSSEIQQVNASEESTEM